MFISSGYREGTTDEGIASCFRVEGREENDSDFLLFSQIPGWPIEFGGGYHVLNPPVPN